VCQRDTLKPESNFWLATMPFLNKLDIQQSFIGRCIFMAGNLTANVVVKPKNRGIVGDNKNIDLQI
jgi:hypothetical protein